MQELIEFLTQNLDVFALSVDDIEGINRTLMDHNLDIRDNATLGCQGWRPMSAEKVR